MYITNEEREILMNRKYYVHLEEIKPNQFVYGVMGVTKLKDAKTMVHTAEKDDFYKKYRVNASTAIFLSDMDKVNILPKNGSEKCLI